MTNSISVIRGKEGVEMKGLNNKEVEEARIFRIGKREFHCKFFNLQRNGKKFFCKCEHPLLFLVVREEKLFCSRL